jgi:hypothetical protein
MEDEMEASSIVLMEKVNGILEKELGSYEIAEGLEFIYKAYVENNNVWLYLTTDKDVDDEQYTGLFESYDIEKLEQLGIQVTEDDEEYNPVWQLMFPFIEEHELMEDKLNEVLSLHVSMLQAIIG